MMFPALPLTLLSEAIFQAVPFLRSEKNARSPTIISGTAIVHTGK
jgi:hypothetical protein